MSCTKLTSLISFGIAPYFREIPAGEINCFSFFTMSFDEKRKKLTQTSKMNLVIKDSGIPSTIQVLYLIGTPNF